MSGFVVVLINSETSVGKKETVGEEKGGLHGTIQPVVARVTYDTDDLEPVIRFLRQ